MDLGAVDRHGGMQHRPVATLPHTGHRRLVHPRRGAADHQPGWGQLWRSHWRLHYLRLAGAGVRPDRQLRAPGQTHPGLAGLGAAGGHPVQDRQRNLRCRPAPHLAGTGHVLQLPAGQAPVAALLRAGRIAGGHGVVRRPGPAGLQRLPPGSGHAGVDHAKLLAGGDHQHWHPTVRGGDDLAEHAGCGRAARGRLPSAGLAADLGHRLCLAAAGTVRLARGQPGGDQRGDLHRAACP
ncbi:hypothetical protein D3C79_787140 [compost metagenome]